MPYGSNLPQARFLSFTLLILSIAGLIYSISNLTKANKNYNDYKKQNPNSTDKNDNNYLDLHKKYKSSIIIMVIMLFAIIATAVSSTFLNKFYKEMHGIRQPIIF